MAEAKTYEGWQSVVFVVGIYEGIVPLVATVLGWNPLLAFPLRLPEVPRVVVCVVVIVAAVAALELLDQAKKRAGG